MAFYKTERTDKTKRDAAIIKSKLPHNWRAILEQRTGRGRCYLSNMVNNVETHRPEWKDVLNLAKEHKNQVREHNEETKKLIAE